MVAGCAPDGKEMLPEAMLFYLLTGKVPSQEQTKDLVADLAARSELDDYVKKIIDSFRASQPRAASLSVVSQGDAPDDPVRRCRGFAQVRARPRASF